MSTLQQSVSDRRRAFHELHRHGCFVIPNPWDVGSARFLESLGFKALATTSSGFAWTRGRADGALSRDATLEQLAEFVSATHLPVNADYQAGFATDVRDVTDSVRLAIETGIAGLSIEDSTGDPSTPLYNVDTAVARIAAARQAIDRAGGDCLLVGRAECFLVGRPNLDETITRLRAYSSAGADCLYAPGIRSRDQITAVVAAVAPKPVNLLVGHASELTVSEIAELGVRRISVGGALARVAWGAFMRSARLIAAKGDFSGFAEAASGRELDLFFADKP